MLQSNVATSYNDRRHVNRARCTTFTRIGKNVTIYGTLNAYTYMYISYLCHLDDFMRKVSINEYFTFFGSISSIFLKVFLSLLTLVVTRTRDETFSREMFFNSLLYLKIIKTIFIYIHIHV